MGLTRSEEFAKIVIKMAAEENLTVREFCEAADVAKGIAVHSTVESRSIWKADFPSQHIVTPAALVLDVSDG